MSAGNDLPFLDFLILDLLSRTGDWNDFEIARQLHCPRSFLLDRLEHLLSRHYLVWENGSYRLSDKGRSAWIPFGTDPAHTAAPSAPPPPFDWTELYIPRPDWPDK